MVVNSYLHCTQLQYMACIIHTKYMACIVHALFIFIYIAGECGLPVFAHGVVVVDNFTATFEGSSLNFTCPTTIIRTECTAEGHWSPDPATHMCINASATAITADMTIDNTGIVVRSEETQNYTSIVYILATSTACASEPVSCSTTVVGVVCSIVFFIVGVVGGFAGGVLVVYCCGKWQLVHQRNHNLQPSQLPPAPLYEDVIVTTVVKDKDKLELKDNVAYGHLK